MASTLDCPRCKVPLRLLTGEVAHANCSRCSNHYHLAVFPAMFRQLTAEAGELLVDPSEASCYYHESKKAEVACEHCGRFLCGLCDIVLEGEHLCPNCLESGRQKGKIKTLANRATMYDEMAFSLAVYPIIIFPLIYFTFLTAPVALFIAIYYWRKQERLIPRGKWRFVVAIIAASLEIITWLGLIVFLVGEAI